MCTDSKIYPFVKNFAGKKYPPMLSAHPRIAYIGSPPPLAGQNTLIQNIPNLKNLQKITKILEIFEKLNKKKLFLKVF